MKGDSLPVRFEKGQLSGQVRSQEEGSSSRAGSTQVHAAGYFLVHKVSKVKMHSFVSPRSWLKLLHEPT